MNVVVKIAGRKALVVWTLPYVTSWLLSPDKLLKKLADPDFEKELWWLNIDMHQRKLNDPGYKPPLPFPAAFILDIHGTPSSLPSTQWHGREHLM